MTTPVEKLREIAGVISASLGAAVTSAEVVRDELILHVQAAAIVKAAPATTLRREGSAIGYVFSLLLSSPPSPGWV